MSPAARAQLEAIRDEWLAPLVARNEELARNLGRAEAERDAAQRERDELHRRIAELEAQRRDDAAVSRRDAPETAEGADAVPSGLRAWLRRLWGQGR